MWSKLSSALKHRPSTPSLAGGDDDLSPSKAEVLAGVYEQHPNLSVFHAEPPSDVPFPPSSPTLSPVMNGRKSIFKKPGKPHPPPINTQTSEPGAFSPLVSPLMLPKKVKSSLNLASGECSVNYLSFFYVSCPLSPPTFPLLCWFQSVFPMSRLCALRITGCAFLSCY